ncbi:MAG: hypothetical protein ABJO36_03220 [Litorimonas sp.]
MMRILKLVGLGLLVLMSLAAGFAKVMQMPQEVAFFESAGLSLGPLIPFGIIQLIGAGLGLIPKTRKLGLASMAVSFLASALMIFVSGNTVFGMVSLIPAVLAGVLAFSKWGAEIRPSK